MQDIVIKNLLRGNKVFYLSMPITSGIRFVDWYSDKGRKLNKDSEEFRKQREKYVIERNKMDYKKVVANIKSKVQYTIIDPCNMENHTLKWRQEQFHKFWERFIWDCVDIIVFLDGWEYSIGCCHEYGVAVESGKVIVDQNMIPITFECGLDKVRRGVDKYIELGIENEVMRKVLGKLEGMLSTDKELEENAEDIGDKLSCISDIVLKDEKLHNLIANNICNIAQYISVSPEDFTKPAYVHIRGVSGEMDDIREAVELLIKSSAYKAVNVRSFSPSKMKGNKLVYGKTIEDLDEIIKIIGINAKEGRHSIINENIDINDGGVSGIVLGGMMEFSPEDTPNCVDKEGACSLPRKVGIDILRKVYGFNPELDYARDYRVEFSIHPKKQGVLNKHTIIWEYEYYGDCIDSCRIKWPNRFSRFLGDKVFGLLVADSLGLKVPKTTVISRKVVPFIFGTDTGNYEKWIRTCPIDKKPGKYYTGSEWVDPFDLVNREDGSGSKDNVEKNIASIMSQDAIEPIYSGAAFIREDREDDLIEGVSGAGDLFMVGEQGCEDISNKAIEKVKELCDNIREHYDILGDVSIEWVYDGSVVWIVQMSQLAVRSNGENGHRTIVEGSPQKFIKVYVKDGLDNLREIIDGLENKDVGIELIGNVGITSHFGDVLRLAGIPSYLVEER